jgi:hypothetical protein
MEVGFSGGCACGSVRYRLSGKPWDTGWCHCRTCQLSSAAPAIVFSTVMAGELAFVEGEALVKRFRSSSFGERQFCGACGTLLTMKVHHQPETIDFTVATLDNPDAVKPGFHIFYGSRIAWADTGDELPRHERFRPETRGL